MLVFNKIERIEKYYNKNTNTYEFYGNGIRQDVKFNFDLNVNANIIANNIITNNLSCKNINANNIKAWNIIASNMNVGNISAWNIKSNNIVANNIDACVINVDNITYYAFCIAYNSLKCKSIRGIRDKSIHRCLDKKIEYIKEEKLTEEQVIKQLEELIEDRESFIDTGDEDDEFFIKDRQALKQAIELLNQKNKVKSELEKFKNDIDTKLKKYKNVELVIPAKQLQQKIDNLIKFFNN